MWRLKCKIQGSCPACPTPKQNKNFSCLRWGKKENLKLALLHPTTFLETGYSMIATSYQNILMHHFDGIIRAYSVTMMRPYIQPFFTLWKLDKKHGHDKLNWTCSYLIECKDRHNFWGNVHRWRESPFLSLHITVENMACKGWQYHLRFQASPINLITITLSKTSLE
jgi:hypothetical protein